MKMYDVVREYIEEADQAEDDELTEKEKQRLMDFVIYVEEVFEQIDLIKKEEKS